MELSGGVSFKMLSNRQSLDIPQPILNPAQLPVDDFCVCQAKERLRRKHLTYRHLRGANGGVIYRDSLQKSCSAAL